MGPLLVWAMRMVDDLSGDILASWAERQRLGKTVTAVPRPCPLDIPVTGQIAGKPWRTALDYHEVPALMRHLGTAAFFVCAFLTGMRPGEVLSLRTGCCPDPVPGPAGRYVIRGREFKIATDDDGNHHI